MSPLFSNKSSDRSILSITLLSFLLLAIFLSFRISNASDSSKSRFTLLPSPKHLNIGNHEIPLKSNGTSNTPSIYVFSEESKNSAAISIINSRLQSIGIPSSKVSLLQSPDEIPKEASPVILLSISKELFYENLKSHFSSPQEWNEGYGSQSYFIKFLKGSAEREIIWLHGRDIEGLLYAAISFSKLISIDHNDVFIQVADIIDWPDFQYRALPIWPLPTSSDNFKRKIDWAVNYKFNRILTHTTAIRKADKFNLPTKDEIEMIKEANDYAEKRGAKITYMLSWAVGSTASNGNDPLFKDGVLFNGLYYTWSQDNLLTTRARQLAEFVKQTNTSSLNLHCIDTYEENWPERSSIDRERFENDRAAADAHVINIFANELRSVNPSIELQFVVYPYQINFFIAENDKYKTWISKLTALIPQDVYLCMAEHNRDQSDSWTALVRQPLVHWINGDAFQWGRFFTTSPCFTKSCYYPTRKHDMIYNAEPIGFFKGEVMQAVAAEYAWNVDAPGNTVIKEKHDGAPKVVGGQKFKRERLFGITDFPLWSWYNAVSVPKEVIDSVLTKACEIEYGKEISKSMIQFYTNNPIGSRGPDVLYTQLNQFHPDEKSYALQFQLHLAEQAINALTIANKSTSSNNEVKNKIGSLLETTYAQRNFLYAAAHRYQAIDAMRKKSINEAELAVEDGQKFIFNDKSALIDKGLWNNKFDKWFESSKEILGEILTGIKLKESNPNNLIVNPGFEMLNSNNGNKSKWIFKPNREERSPDSLTGKNANLLLLKPSEIFSSFSQQISCKESEAYYLEFWVKKQNNARFVPSVTFKDSENKILNQKTLLGYLKPNTAINGYEAITATFTTPPKTASFEFKIQLDWFGASPVEPVSLIVDDIYLFKVPGSIKPVQLRVL